MRRRQASHALATVGIDFPIKRSKQVIKLGDCLTEHKPCGTQQLVQPSDPQQRCSGCGARVWHDGVIFSCPDCRAELLVSYIKAHPTANRLAYGGLRCSSCSFEHQFVTESNGED